MPQVSLFGVPDIDEYILKLKCTPTPDRPTWVKYINSVDDIPKIPRFNEAFRDNFIGWDLHHIAGEYAHATLLKFKKLYYRQPWYTLTFMPICQHRQLHSLIDKYPNILRTRIHIPPKGPR